MKYFLKFYWHTVSTFVIIYDIEIPEQRKEAVTRSSRRVALTTTPPPPPPKGKTFSRKLLFLIKKVGDAHYSENTACHLSYSLGSRKFLILSCAAFRPTRWVGKRRSRYDAGLTTPPREVRNTATLSGVASHSFLRVSHFYILSFAFLLFS